jgi:integrase/recombinase XerC
MSSYPFLPAPVTPAPLAPALTAADLLRAFLAGRNPRTLRAFRKDVEDFAAFARVPTPEAAAGLLLSGGHGAANALALSYKASLVGRRLSAATVNRCLAALRSLVKLARTLGLCGWALEVEGLRSEPYRDTRGPGREGFRRILEALAARTDAKGLRDAAAVRLLFDLALRRAEVVGLDREDLDLEGGTLAVLGKGRTQRVRLTLPGPTREALAAWLAVRGDEPGPLFRPLDRSGRAVA